MSIRVERLSKIYRRLNMKKLFLIMFLSGFVCAITSAQDDMYFIPKKTKEVKEKKKSNSLTESVPVLSLSMYEKVPTWLKRS